MAKKRKTLKQKKQSSVRKVNKVGKITKKAAKTENILVVDEKYIKKDLGKTLFWSIVFTGVIVALWKMLG